MSVRTGPIRVLVAEDSPTARQLLVEMLRSDPSFSVVGEASNGAEAVEKAMILSPDLITMDVHMPVMDGLDATKEIMREAPTPIIIVSTSVSRNDVAIALSATQAGALSVIQKPGMPGSMEFDRERDQFLAMAKSMAEVKVVRRWSTRASRENRAVGPAVSGWARGGRARPRLVAIGTSTGGPAALHRILIDLPPELPVPIVVVQHMAHGFTDGLASWLSANVALKVTVATAGVPLAAGTVYLAPDDHHLGVTTEGRAVLSDTVAVGGFRPSVDFLFDSCGRSFGAGLAALILTGMGRDGVEGLRTVRASGGYVLGQDEATSIVFGMAREAILAGLVHEVAPLGALGKRILELLAVGNNS